MPNEWLAYGSVRVPVSKGYAIEPYYFYSRVENAPRPENRFLLNNQFRTAKGYELNIGALYGKAGVDRDAETDNIFGGYATVLLPFSQTVWGQLSFRWEKAPYEGFDGGCIRDKTAAGKVNSANPQKFLSASFSKT
ncbi:MAG: hypothetical protein IPJ82_02020 [Lewinellaceae bacterium]|nr:hypothetical protein [Lewinellaceae bacterium]